MSRTVQHDLYAAFKAGALDFTQTGGRSMTCPHCHGAGVTRHGADRRLYEGGPLVITECTCTPRPPRNEQGRDIAAMDREQAARDYVDTHHSSRELDQ